MNPEAYRHVQVRVSPAEAAAWLRAAQERDLRLAQLVRHAVRAYLGAIAPEVDVQS